MYSYGHPHMAERKQDDQLEHTYNSYERIRDVDLKTWQRRWTIGKSGERVGISVLAARHNDDDDDVFTCLKLFLSTWIRRYHHQFIHTAQSSLDLSSSIPVILAWELIRERHLWVCSCFSSSASHVLFVFLGRFMRWEVIGCTTVASRGVVSRFCSRQRAAFSFCLYLFFSSILFTQSLRSGRIWHKVSF